MTHPYRQLVNQWFSEIWNKDDTTGLERFVNSDTVFHSANGSQLKGMEEFRDSMKQLRVYFDKFYCLVLHSIIEGNTLCATVRIKATHRKTGKRVQFQAMNRVLFDEKGKIKATWDTIDWLTCLINIQALPKDVLALGLSGMLSSVNKQKSCC